ncbi:MAG: hypothetical protein AAGC63_16870 [Propionicimonas sp.]
MSISSMAGLAVARNLRPPTRSDAGLDPAGSPKAEGQPTSLEILAKTVPVGLIAAYTTFIATVTQFTKAVPGQPVPDPLIGYRWAGWAILVVLAAALTFTTYRQRAGQSARANTMEIAAVTIAAAAWGLGTPESPLLASIPDKATGGVVIALIVFVGVGVNYVLAGLLKKPATG